MVNNLVFRWPKPKTSIFHGFGGSWYMPYIDPFFRTWDLLTGMTASIYRYLPKKVQRTVSTAISTIITMSFPEIFFENIIIDIIDILLLRFATFLVILVVWVICLRRNIHLLRVEVPIIDPYHIVLNDTCALVYTPCFPGRRLVGIPRFFLSFKNSNLSFAERFFSDLCRLNFAHPGVPLLLFFFGTGLPSSIKTSGSSCFSMCHFGQTSSIINVINKQGEPENPKDKPDTCNPIFYTRHLLHQTPFTPNTFYTKHLLHQPPFEPDTLNTKQLLRRTLFTSNIFYIKATVWSR